MLLVRLNYSSVAYPEDNIMIAVDPSTGTIFCEACGDTTYPDTFESLYLITRIRVEESNDHSREPGLVGGKGRGRGEWKSWNPNNIAALSEREVVRTSCRGELNFSSFMGSGKSLCLSRSAARS